MRVPRSTEVNEDIFSLIPRPHPVTLHIEKQEGLVYVFNLPRPHYVLTCTRPSHFSACNTEKLGVAWERG